MVYLPLGNQTPDQWGADRTPGAEKFSAGVVALDLSTGKVRWNYQFTHHDLWDMDVGSQPTLLDMKTADGIKPALIAPTKQGSLYVLDRRDGTPVYPIEERPVPQNPEEGEHTAPTQPFSPLPNFHPDRKESDMWGVTPLDQLWCRVAYKQLRYDGHFTPPMRVSPSGRPANSRNVIPMFRIRRVSIEKSVSRAVIPPRIRKDGNSTASPNIAWASDA